MQNNHYSIENEQSVIGGLIIDNNKLNEVSKIINANDFYDAKNKAIFNAMIELKQLDMPFDLTTLPERLRGAEGEIISYLGEVAKNTPSTANILHYTKTKHQARDFKTVLSL